MKGKNAGDKYSLNYFTLVCKDEDSRKAIYESNLERINTYLVPVIIFLVLSNIQAQVQYFMFQAEMAMIPILHTSVGLANMLLYLLAKYTCKKATVMGAINLTLFFMLGELFILNTDLIGQEEGLLLHHEVYLITVIL